MRTRKPVAVSTIFLANRKRGNAANSIVSGLILYAGAGNGDALNNEIYNNSIVNGTTALLVGGSGTAGTHTTGTKIYGNTISNHASVGDVSGGAPEYEFFDNLVTNANYIVRTAAYTMSPSGPGKVYYYRNKFWNPPLMGGAITLDNCCLGVPPPGGNHHFYFYHNSINNRANGIDFGLNPGDSCIDCLFINNVINSEQPLLVGSRDAVTFGDGFCSTDERIDVWDYNWAYANYVTNQAATCAWYGPNNKKNPAAVWPMDTLPSDWRLPVGHACQKFRDRRFT